jgi:hypothetical protein
MEFVMDYIENFQTSPGIGQILQKNLFQEYFGPQPVKPTTTEAE